MSLYIFMLCINVGLSVVHELVPGGGGQLPTLIEPPKGVTLGDVETIAPECDDPNNANTKYCRFITDNTESAATVTAGNLQSSLTFGDWFTGVSIFINVFSMGYLMDLMGIVSFLPSFVFSVKLIFLLFLGSGVFYIISARGTRASI